MAVEWIKKLLLGWGEAKTHPGELIVDQAGIQTSNQRARHGSGEDEEGKAGDGASEETKCRVLQGLDSLSSLGRVSEHAMLFENRQPSEYHGAVDGKGGAEMGSQTVLGDARMTAGLEEVVLESALDHPPANNTLEADHAADADQLPGHGRSHSASRDEVGSRQEHGDTDHTTPKSMSPFHEVDLLKVCEIHAGVELRELRRCSVLVELACPLGIVHGPERARDGAPFGDA